MHQSISEFFSFWLTTLSLPLIFSKVQLVPIKWYTQCHKPVHCHWNQRSLSRWYYCCCLWSISDRFCRVPSIDLFLVGRPVFDTVFQIPLTDDCTWNGSSPNSMHASVCPLLLYVLAGGIDRWSTDCIHEKLKSATLHRMCTVRTKYMNYTNRMISHLNYIFF